MPTKIKRPGIGRKLKHIDLEVTRECNLRCRHCSASSKKRGLELSENQIKEILEQARGLGLEKVGLTGGEPFLVREKIKNIGNFAVNELKTPIHIHSNGTKITKQDAEWIKNIDAEITVPLYGNIASIHEKITDVEGRSSKLAEDLIILSMLERMFAFIWCQ